MQHFDDFRTVFPWFKLPFCETFTIPIYVNRVFRHVFGIFYYFCLLFYSYIYLTNQKNVEQSAKSVTFCTTVKNSADIGVFYSDISRVFYIFSTYSSISSCWLRCPHLLLRQCLHLKCQHLKQQMSQYLICQPLPLHPEGLQVRSHHMNLMCR